MGDAKVSGLCSRRKNICFSGPAIRPVISTLGFLSGYETHPKETDLDGHSKLLFSGRLVSSGSICRDDQSPWPDSLRPPSESRFPDKLEKVRPNPISAVGVPGSIVRPKEDGTKLTGGQAIQVESYGRENISRKIDFQKAVGKFDWFPQFRCKSGTFGPQFALPPHELAQQKHLDFHQRQLGSSRSGFAFGSGSLVGRRPDSDSSSHEDSLSCSRNHDGRLRSGLVRHTSASRGEGYLDTRRSGLFNKLERIKGSTSDAGLFCRRTARTDGACSLRQYVGPGLHKETRDLGMPSSVGIDIADSSSLSDLGDHSRSGSLEGCSQRVSGQGFQVGSHRDGVDNRLHHIHDVVQRFWRASGGSFCHERKSSAGSLCFPLPGPSSSSHGRFQPGVESVGFNISVSSLELTPSSCSSPGEVCGEGIYDSSLLAHEALVSPLEKEVPDLSTSAPGSSPVSGHNSPGSRGMQQPGKLQPSRLDTLESVLLKKPNFSASVAQTMLARWRGTTKDLYQRHWEEFLDFLECEDIPEESLTIGHVFQYLDYLHLERGLAYSTISNHKCAIAEPLSLALGISFDCTEMEYFMKGLANVNPKIQKPPPQWDLSVLLRYLRSEVFEPLQEASRDKLLMKTLVLVFLACGRRISEVSFIVLDHRVLEEGVQFKWKRGFRPKWASPKFNPAPPSISSIDVGVAGDDLLCPVRAWKILYERRCAENAQLQLQKEKFFDWLWDRSYNQIRYLVISAVLDSEKWSGRPFSKKVGPHDLKKFAVSYSLQYLSTSSDDRGVLVQRVGNQSHTVIERHYRRSVPPVDVAFVVPLGTVPGCGTGV